VSDCQCCPECHPSGNPCAACQAGGICDGAFGQGCRCNELDQDDLDRYLDDDDNDDSSA